MRFSAYFARITISVFAVSMASTGLAQTSSVTLDTPKLLKSLSATGNDISWLSALKTNFSESIKSGIIEDQEKSPEDIHRVVTLLKLNEHDPVNYSLGSRLKLSLSAGSGLLSAEICSDIETGCAKLSYDRIRTREKNGPFEYWELKSGYTNLAIQIDRTLLSSKRQCEELSPCVAEYSSWRLGASDDQSDAFRNSFDWSLPRMWLAVRKTSGDIHFLDAEFQRTWIVLSEANLKNLGLTKNELLEFRAAPGHQSVLMLAGKNVQIMMDFSLDRLIKVDQSNVWMSNKGLAQLQNITWLPLTHNPESVNLGSPLQTAKEGVIWQKAIGRFSKSPFNSGRISIKHSLELKSLGESKIIAAKEDGLGDYLTSNNGVLNLHRDSQGIQSLSRSQIRADESVHLGAGSVAVFGKNGMVVIGPDGQRKPTSLSMPNSGMWIYGDRNALVKSGIDKECQYTHYVMRSDNVRSWKESGVAIPCNRFWTMGSSSSGVIWVNWDRSSQPIEIQEWTEGN